MDFLINMCDFSCQWVLKEPMNIRRHLPGVGVHNGYVYVVGGANDNWEAQSAVEAYDPATDRYVYRTYIPQKLLHNLSCCTNTVT